MNNNPKANPDAPENEIDRILSTEDHILPTSGFLSAVMERVREEAAAPPPIPFPWKRALPGFVLAAGVFGWGGVLIARSLPEMMQQMSINTVRVPVFAAHDLAQAGWIALAGVVSLLSWWFSRRLTRRSGGF
jgi:hypothetical protein